MDSHVFLHEKKKSEVKKRKKKDKSFKIKLRMVSCLINVLNINDLQKLFIILFRNYL